MNQVANWICCQLGAREHYAIPRALHQSGRLAHLITDAWVKPDSFLHKIPGSQFKSLGDRHHPDLAQASVYGFTNQLIAFEAQQKLQKTAAWPKMIARNNWFQAQVIRQLRQFTPAQLPADPILFTYSYAALDILRYAKSQGWTTMLGQIDPGIMEEKIVLKEFEKYPDLAPDWRPVPKHYWHNWLQECQLTDYILVNSNWSKQLLVEAGVTAEKICIVPLVYQPPQAALDFQRTYPDKFTHDRPLRVLFLGLVTLRKGIVACLEAIAQLQGEPIEFYFVGAEQINIPEPLKKHPQVHWVGSVPRSETSTYYKNADVFLFPTLSDGFGLTQLEAQAWQLPLITSQFCAQVIEENLNGMMLKQTESSRMADEIAQILKKLLQEPHILKQYSSQSKLQPKNTLSNLSSTLNQLQ